MTALLSTSRLVKSFGGVHAVDHVDLSFGAGEIVALIGPNGSGKTTFINIVTGMLPIDSGAVCVGSRQFTSVASADIAALGITRTFQNARLIPQMTVLDNIMLTLTKRSAWSALFERQRKHHVVAAEEELKRVGLWEKRHAKAENLSFGQRKLLEVARALSMRSRIYFFDEPFSGLFPEMVKTISQIMRELRASGAAVVLVEHDMALVRELADRCYVLDSGRTLAQGSPDDVLGREAVIDAYLGK